MEGTLLFAFNFSSLVVPGAIVVGIFVGAAVIAAAVVALPATLGVVAVNCIALTAGVIAGVATGVGVMNFFSDGGTPPSPPPPPPAVEQTLEFQRPDDDSLSYACDIVVDGKTKEIRSDRDRFEQDVREYLKSLPTDGVQYIPEIDGTFGPTQKENFRKWTKEILP